MGESKYYYYKNGIRRGPSSPEDMLRDGIDMNTWVWCTGMPDWQIVGEVPSLREILAEEMASTALPPPIPTQPSKTVPDASQPLRQQVPPAESANHPLSPPPNYLAASIILTIVLFSALALIAIVSSMEVGEAFAAGDYKRAQKMSRLSKRLLIWAVILRLISIAVVPIVVISMS